jgi:hypothetical protein
VVLGLLIASLLAGVVPVAHYRAQVTNLAAVVVLVECWLLLTHIYPLERLRLLLVLVVLLVL